MFAQNINFNETLALTCHNTHESHSRQFFLRCRSRKPQNLHTTGQRGFFLVSLRPLCTENVHINELLSCTLCAHKRVEQMWQQGALMRIVKAHLPKPRLWTADVHYTATLCNEKCKQAAAGDVGGHKAQTLNPEGAWACFNHSQWKFTSSYKIATSHHPSDYWTESFRSTYFCRREPKQISVCILPITVQHCKSKHRKPTPVGHPNP